MNPIKDETKKEKLAEEQLNQVDGGIVDAPWCWTDIPDPIEPDLTDDTTE